MPLAIFWPWLQLWQVIRRCGQLLFWPKDRQMSMPLDFFWTRLPLQPQPLLQLLLQPQPLLQPQLLLLPLLQPLHQPQLQQIIGLCAWLHFRLIDQQGPLPFVVFWLQLLPQPQQVPRLFGRLLLRQSPSLLAIFGPHQFIGLCEQPLSWPNYWHGPSLLFIFCPPQFIWLHGQLNFLPNAQQLFSFLPYEPYELTRAFLMPPLFTPKVWLFRPFQQLALLSPQRNFPSYSF